MPENRQLNDAQAECERNAAYEQLLDLIARLVARQAVAQTTGNAKGEPSPPHQNERGGLTE